MSQRRDMLAPAVYAWLFHTDQGLPQLSTSLALAIQRECDLDDVEFARLHVAGVPTRIQNFMIAETCARQFGADLLNVHPFYQCDGLWWMDLDERRAGRGYLMPITDPRHGWIRRMVCFSSPRDRHGVPVRLRRELRSAA